MSFLLIYNEILIKIAFRDKTGLYALQAESTLGGESRALTKNTRIGNQLTGFISYTKSMGSK